jgi:hypothetical protein
MYSYCKGDIDKLTQDIQGVAQLTPQRKLTCADSNNITRKTDSFFLSAFLIELEAYQIHQSH